MPLIVEIFAQAAQGQPLCLFLAAGITASLAAWAFASLRCAVRVILR